MSSLIQALLEPISPERFRVNRERYDGLPQSLKTPEQIIGDSHHSCGATHGVLERCDFACTSCYLGEEANAAEPLPHEAVLQQLDALRRFLGPQGKALPENARHPVIFLEGRRSIASGTRVC